ncbi:ROK family protein [Microbacterium sp. B2969]|uniref:ROK family protein n=1 Tax=Microbacterium alkaliflavum TaxID=3248839 RepID=A0ABW7QC97_9MICO
MLQFAWDAEVFTSNDAMPVVGMTRSTTIDAIDELIGLGLVRELPNARAVGEYRNGRPSRRFEFRSDGAVVVGIDAGRAHLTTIVADLRGRPLARETKETGSPEDSAEDRRRAIVDAVDSALALAGHTRHDVIAACAGVPAPVDAEGRSPAHRDDFWRRMNPDLLGLLGEWAPIVKVENDASLAAVAEGSVGVATGHESFVSLLAGARLGAGVVVDGHLLRGAHGGAGEMVGFDHVLGVGEVGGIGYRLVEWAREAIAAGEIGPTHPLAMLPADELTGRAVLELAHAGDAPARSIVERAAAVLARVAGIFGSMYDPELIVVSGAIADGIGDVLAGARGMLPTELDLPAPELVASTLGAEVVAIGAVSAAVETARADLLRMIPLVQHRFTGEG